MKNLNKGFTLAELLTVVLIVGILAGLAVPQYTRSVERARATEAMNLVKSINDAIYAYAAARKGTTTACPTRFSQLMITLPVSRDDVSSISLTYFKYGIADEGASVIVPGTNCRGVLATRINGGGRYDYKIWNPYRVRSASGRGASLACASSSSSGTVGYTKSSEVCKSLGLSE